MTPRDDSCAFGVIVGFADYVGDFGVGLGGNLVDDLAGEIA